MTDDPDRAAAHERAALYDDLIAYAPHWIVDEDAADLARYLYEHGWRRP